MRDHGSDCDAPHCGRSKCPVEGPAPFFGHSGRLCDPIGKVQVRVPLRFDDGSLEQEGGLLEPVLTVGVNGELGPGPDGGPRKPTILGEGVKLHVEVGAAVLVSEAFFSRRGDDSLEGVQSRLDRGHAVSHRFDHGVRPADFQHRLAATGGPGGAHRVVHKQPRADDR